MPLGEPPPAAQLTRLPARRLAGMVLSRVYRRGRGSPWWFASVPRRAGQPGGGGRFDLPDPDGTCYLGTSIAAAVVEAFQEFGEGLLPDTELRRRLRAEVRAPVSAPVAAWLSAARARGLGVTAALWAGGPRALTQRWAVVLRRAGWRALLAGVQHDPSGRLRGVALFDAVGEHAPYDDHASWSWTAHDLHGDPAVTRALAQFGITVTRPDPQLAVARDRSLDPGV